MDIKDKLVLIAAILVATFGYVLASPLVGHEALEPGVLSGAVRSEDGTAGGLLILTAHGPLEGDAKSYRTVSGRDGEYRIELVPGTYRVYVEGQRAEGDAVVTIQSGQATARDVVATRPPDTQSAT